MTEQMNNWSRSQLESYLAEQLQAYKDFQNRGLKLDMSRGKPGPDLLDQCNDLLGMVDDPLDESGADVRNYGGLAGIPEVRRLFGEIFGIPSSQVIAGGNSSLMLMFSLMTQSFVRGAGPGLTPWSAQEKCKFICPAPGYDRHFTLCQYFGLEMIPVPMREDGPDVDMIEALVKDDPTIKGMWCVPMYSNPDGITCSDQVVRRLAAMPAAAEDFRIYWDCAYILHHLDAEDHDHLLNLYDACVEAGHEDRPYLFASSSKVTFAGAGICGMGMSKANCEWTLKQLQMQAICFDKVNQLRHCRALPDLSSIEKLMIRHAELLRPRFAAVQEVLGRELAGLDMVRWTNPKGGYFISFYAPEGCAKRIVSLCKEAGVVLTGAGATYPYGKDPLDSNIRIAPTYPPVEELVIAMELFCTAVKLACAEKLLNA